MASQTTKTYTIKEVAKKLNVSPGTLRQWEKELNDVLIIPRSNQGARYYTDDEISLLETIKQMRDKNLSKDMIRSLLEDEFKLKIEAGIDEEESILPKKQEMKQFINSFDALKNQFINEVKNEIQTTLRKNILDEVKKEISKGSLHIVKNLSDSIYKSNEKTNAEINELSEDIRGLSNQIADSSDAAAEEFKTMIHYISTSTEVTHSEISGLIQTLNTDRETFIDSINREREEYWKDINRRELIFQDLIVNFRHTAATEEKKKPWWKIW